MNICDNFFRWSNKEDVQKDLKKAIGAFVKHDIDIIICEVRFF